MEDILITFEVSKLEKFTEVNDIQNSNIEFILVIYELSKLEKSISVIKTHPLNIYSQLFILLFHINST